MESAKRSLLWAVMSIAISLFTIAFPYLFPDVFPDGVLVYYVITIPLGIVAGFCAYRSGSNLLIALAIIAGLSPLLVMWVVLAVLKLVYIVTGGQYPGPEWL
ncbi:hypothetical protein [Corynebacterium alimapuense]|uniref:Uncharacterized protein n=1 Tax=Corynebacterium alimapuense TaxID=1576874 RepID=A0A3M8KA35_9CORY|nr:hypothetical protein [Corynebacterium alimapuense]RNE49394.1 hypothetical protein C5L39_03235 [Corynebacterium alimapuense]